MPAFDKILHSDIIGEVWRAVLLRIKDGKVKQLMTLNPIQVYNETMSYKLDKTHLDIDINASVENIIQKPIQRAFDFLSLDFKSAEKNMFSLNVSVDVDVRMDYKNIGLYLDKQYAHQEYWILDNRVGLLFDHFILKMKNGLLEVEMPIHIKARYKNLNYAGDAMVFARGSIVYHPFLKTVKVTDISYVASSEKWILRLINMIYYKDIVAALEDFMQFNITQELDEGLALLQKKVDEHNEEYNFIVGEANNLQLNRIQLLQDGGIASLHIDGMVKLRRY
ncbi:MAG: DUF4403 family protein [Chitinophagales bacterium]|nr:DUF4403 family protein [Chitinophagales bacterium]MCZ2394156.1 DUF4403 family protein [Chitinophagales bacterium]